ncbi:hypothetical protein PanWU01x14_355610 [Parasponia andersonii]|uniref:Uncharacterized protein n=1 Tax=Parasponia andersonii TaxID=3476 RepID=A0A2P5A989_PARAD|nr:hypothetical protein PanWU01x14_355610 [Parasponia andersonii]
MQFPIFHPIYRSTQLLLYSLVHSRVESRSLYLPIQPDHWYLEGTKVSSQNSKRKDDVVHPWLLAYKVIRATYYMNKFCAIVCVIETGRETYLKSGLGSKRRVKREWSNSRESIESFVISRKRLVQAMITNLQNKRLSLEILCTKLIPRTRKLKRSIKFRKSQIP